MSTLHVRSNGDDAINSTVTLLVWATPTGDGNLHGGQYAFCYSHKTLNTKPGEKLSIVLDDRTDLKLTIVDYLTTAPNAMTVLLPPSRSEPATLCVNDLTAGLLVFFSIVLQSAAQPSIVLFCDPQVGNDPKVSPT